MMRLTIRTSDRDRARALCERLTEAAEESSGTSAASWFEEPTPGMWQVDAFYEAEPDREALLALIGDLLSEETRVALEPLPDANWVALSQAALPPVRAGRFVVHGSHDRGTVGFHLNAIEIDAGEAFGTAHHATTRGCLEALDRLARRHNVRRILDLGCGSGVLAIAASRLWPRAAILASDLDPIAIDVASANVALNRAGTRIRLCVAGGLSHGRLRAAAPYDLIVANILAGPLVGLAPDMALAASRGGLVVLSGILGEQVREVVGAYRMAGFRLLDHRLDHNWATLTLQSVG